MTNQRSPHFKPDRRGSMWFAPLGTVLLAFSGLPGSAAEGPAQPWPAAERPAPSSPVAERFHSPRPPLDAWVGADVFVTAQGTGDRLTQKSGLSSVPLAQPDEHTPTIMLDRGKRFQTIVGIGGALTDASAETFFKLPAGRREEILTALFDSTRGNGFTLCRTHIHSCDFSSESYSYTEVPGDTALKHFSIERDMKYKIPFIKAAAQRAGAGFRLFASPWSPPAWMKTNGSMLQGGALRPEYRQAWADYVVRFVREYERAGVPIWGLTVQNEPMAVQPWESCIFTAEEERDFVKYYLGPTLARSGLSGLKLMIWDHNRGIMYQRAAAVYSDPEAAKYVWGTGFHWYVGDHFDNVRLVRDAFPDKELVFTEGTEATFHPDSLLEWKWGETFGRSMIMDLNNGAAGWVAWNVLLDERGGPNHVGNYCTAPIIADTRTGALTYMNSFQYIGHFSRFIRPGARRIVASSNWDPLLATAFVNPDGKIAVVVMNTSDQSIDFQAWMEGRAVRTSCPAHSIITLIL
jgi:glucosylceramidase